MVSKASLRYAKALFRIAVEQEIVEKILKDVHFVKNTIESSDELNQFLRSPVIKPDDKIEVLDQLFGNETDPLTNRFFSLLVQKSREKLLEEIMNGFVQYYNEHAGIIEVDVFSAMPLADGQHNDLVRALEDFTNKKVNITRFENPELMGGLAVRIDDTVIDGTVKHKMEQLLQRFKEAPLE